MEDLNDGQESDSKLRIRLTSFGIWAKNFSKTMTEHDKPDRVFEIDTTF